jgi:hypothetical protein
MHPITMHIKLQATTLESTYKYFKVYTLRETQTHGPE